MSKLYKTVCRYVPAVSFWLFLTAIVAGAVQVLCICSTPFADFFNSTVCAAFRVALSYITGWIPFSVAETLIYALPIVFVAALVGCIRAAANGWHSALRYVFGVLSAAALIYVLFVFTFAPGYRATPLNEKLALSREEVSAAQLQETAETLADRAAQTLDEVTFLQHGASVMPYDYDTLSEKLMDAYDAVSQKYPFISQFHSRVKSLTVSPLMTYTHISGVYTMFTGEANINTNYPDYVVVYSAAHELAHQRGIAREDEANFVAFLVCTASDDPYIRYCGYQNMYEYVASALYSASSDRYYTVLQSLDLRVRYEMIAYNEFFAPYRDTVVAEVSETVNNAYLVLQGTQGVRSYGMVVDLAVAYLTAEE